MAKRVLLYLHGFQSSKNSYKAQCVKDYLQAHSWPLELIIPDLPDLPSEAMAYLSNLLEGLKNQTVYLIGSSLGAYYANFLAQSYHCKAVLINPALRPFELLEDYLGEHINPYTKCHYLLDKQQIESLKSFYIPRMISPEKIFVLLQMQDEVLDAGEASAYFYQSRCLIEPSGNHAFEQFEQHLPAIFAWLFME